MPAAKKNNYEASKSSKYKYQGQFKGQSFKSKGKSFNTRRCYHCGRKNHMKKDCTYYKKSLQYNAERKRTVQTVQITEEPNSAIASTSGFAFMAGDDCQQPEKGKITFLLDSGASDHIVKRDDLFSSFIELKPPMKISITKNGAFINATKKGIIQVTTNMGIEGVLENVLYCPEVPNNLLSILKMQQAGMKIVFDETGGVKVTKNGKVLMKGKPLNNLIGVDFVVKNKTIKVKMQANNIVSNNYELWHQRLGHIEKSKFPEIKNKQMISDMSQIEHVVPDNNLCEACINGKQARLPFKKAKDKTDVKRPLFIIHTDVCGPITLSTIDNKNYFVIFVDEFTHYCVTYLITYKSDVFKVFQDFVAKSEIHFNLKIAHLYCDEQNNNGKSSCNDFLCKFRKMFLG